MKKSLLTLLLTSSFLGCANEDALERLEKTLQTQARYECDCAIQEGEYINQQDCIADYGLPTSAQYACMRAAYDAAGSTSQQGVDCVVEAYEAYGDCMTRLSCDALYGMQGESCINAFDNAATACEISDAVDDMLDDCFDS